METCPRCHSALLGAAEPCSVCGAPVGISADDFLSDLLGPPGTRAEPEAVDPAGSPASPLPAWAEHDLSERPRRTGHDGATRTIDAAAYSPVPERTQSTNPDDRPTRSVPALSSRVSADIKVGPARHHRLVAGTMGLLAVVLFLGGVTGTLLLDANGPASADAAEESWRDPDATVHPDATVDADRPVDTDDTDDTVETDRPMPDRTMEDGAAAWSSLVTVSYQGCDATPVLHGGMLVTNDSTVVVPLPADPPTADVVVTTARGDIGGTIVGWGANDRLAIIQLRQPTAAPRLTWASANRVTSGAELTVLSHQNGTWTSATVVAAGVDRNTNGVMSRIRLAEGGLTEASIVLDAEGLVVGVVRPGDTTAIAASDEVRPTLAAFLTNGGWTPAPCSVPSSPGSETGTGPSGG